MEICIIFFQDHENKRGNFSLYVCLWRFYYGPFCKDKNFKIKKGTYRWILLVRKEEK